MIEVRIIAQYIVSGGGLGQEDKMLKENIIMKKRVFAILTAILVVCLGTVAVSAAVSPTAETATVLADAATSADGDVEVLDQSILADVLTFVDESIEEIFGVVTVDADEVEPGTVVIATDDGEETVVPEVKAAFDFTPSTENQELLAAQGYVDVTFAVDVAEGANVVILHYNGTDWEKIPATVANGQVTGRFTSFSPIVIVELVSETIEVGPAETPQGGVAPKTGEVISILCIAAFGCLAGAVASGKKSKKN